MWQPKKKKKSSLQAQKEGVHLEEWSHFFLTSYSCFWGNLKFNPKFLNLKSSRFSHHWGLPVDESNMTEV